MADIGDKLRSAREAKGLSIEDIEKATKIQGRYLTAIEQNEFDKLPGDFYVRAFIRQYAQIVGLDGKQLLSEYHNEIPQAEPEEYVEDSIDNKSEEVHKTTNSKKKLWKDYLPRIIIGVGIIVVVLVCYVVYAHFSSSNNQNDNSASDVSVSSDNSNKPKKKKKIKKNTVKIRELATGQYRITGLKKNRNMVVRAGEQATNVSISINGVRQFSQVLNSGQKHTLRLPVDAQSVVVTFSNGSGTSISFGGKKVPYDTQASGNTLTFYLGKEHRTSQSNTTNNSTTNNSSTTGHTGTNSNNQQQGQHQTGGTANSQNNQHTGQTNTQNSGNSGQTGQQNGQSNTNEQNNDNSHSDDSSSSNNGGR